MAQNRTVEDYSTVHQPLYRASQAALIAGPTADAAMSIYSQRRPGVTEQNPIGLRGSIAVKAGAVTGLLVVEHYALKGQWSQKRERAFTVVNFLMGGFFAGTAVYDSQVR